MSPRLALVVIVALMAVPWAIFGRADGARPAPAPPTTSTTTTPANGGIVCHDLAGHRFVTDRLDAAALPELCHG